jgi:ABC-type branched-subunit amino acid transport system substrate-binding protein
VLGTFAANLRGEPMRFKNRIVSPRDSSAKGAVVRGALKVLLAGVVAIGVSTAALAGVPGAGASGQPLQATEIGVTPTEIRIAVIADVNNAAAPGLFQGAVDGVEAFGRYINKQGGLAGRKVVVDFIDSRLSADAARDAVIQACQNDFAIVGTSALFLNNIAPLIGCPDKAGKATGLPDLASVQTTFAHQCSPVSHDINAPALDCTTKDQHPQTYNENVGSPKYLKKRFKLTKAAWILGNDIKGTLDATLPVAEAQRSLGLKGENFLVSAAAPQATYTPFLQMVGREGIQYVDNWEAAISLTQALKEAQIQGLKIDAWNCTTACYSKKDFLDPAGPAAEGTFVWIGGLPLEEKDLNKAMATMIKEIGPDKINGFASASWNSSLLFRDAVNAIVKSDGENGLTRANLLKALDNIHAFNADGMIGTIDVGARKTSPCFVQLQVQHGKFVRVYPKKKGTMDCNTGNVVTVKYDNKT